MNTQNLIDEALDYREMAISKMRAEMAAQIRARQEHAIATGVAWNTSLAEAERWYAAAHVMLKTSDVFVWTKETEGAVIRAADKLPADVPFHRAWLPVPCGFWWLGRESALVARCETNRDLVTDLDVDRSVCSIMYRVVDDYILMEAHTLNHGEPTRGPTAFWGAAWHEGETLTQFLTRVRTERPTASTGIQTEWWNQTTQQLSRWILSACLWMQQKVVHVGLAQPSRGQRRRAERQGMNSTTRIIVLRRAEQQHHEATGTGQPLQWRIPVRGHWRAQYFPSKGAHIPIYIDDFWKGPKDAPVKAPSRIIYKVAR